MTSRGSQTGHRGKVIESPFQKNVRAPKSKTADSGSDRAASSGEAPQVKLNDVDIR